MRVELPSPQLRDPGDRAVGHDNFLDAIDPSSLSEVDARLMETADRLIGVDAHLSMLRATPIAEQPRPATEDLAPWSSRASLRCSRAGGLWMLFAGFDGWLRYTTMNPSSERRHYS